ncbi:hypothetical protein ACM46_11945 [Chryseobacterium angstadtii]|uniref:Uncharacterized protein n=1 Tax=Chryseobacterium angstadtii TaxID=558151 RepID=A0A0J7IGW0_9FLAO|nr:hypothetical protein [Chryseobacterium angstadtii]KMQ65226.1 hypothetical protein ACM46_11945 [Chryseobacterium angstadtii]
MKKILFTFSLALSVIVWGQKKTTKTNNNLVLYTYQTFNCDNKGYFDAGKYKKEEIDGVYQLLYQFNGALFDNHTVFKLSDVDDVRKNKNIYLQQLEKQYQEKKKELYGIQVINLPEWKNLHQETIRIFENEYQLKKEDLIAYSDPASLKNSQFYGTCKEYIDAVSSPDKQKMYTLWKNFVETKSKNNASPQSVIDKFNAQFNDPRKDDYALIQLVGFGFYNCANESFRPDPNDEGTLYEKFDQIFAKLKQDCDEP